jgi:hypothetical protein
MRENYNNLIARRDKAASLAKQLDAKAASLRRELSDQMGYRVVLTEQQLRSVL